jgi:Zn-dependent protease
LKWSAKLGRFAGIDVYVHVTFLLLLAWIAFSTWTETGSPAAVAASLVLILLLFLCVVLHEYGHALTARRFGIGTRSITLLPIGGVALLRAMPRDPWQEILVALAGPAVNVVIAAGLFLLMVIGSRPGSLLAFDPVTGSLLPTLLTANLVLALFNLLPAFPMDGGRVLRAGLALRMDRVSATRIAARVGRLLALGLAVFGWFYSPILLLIAVFVWIGAGAEADAVETAARRDPPPDPPDPR